MRADDRSAAAQIAEHYPMTCILSLDRDQVASVVFRSDKLNLLDQDTLDSLFLVCQELRGRSHRGLVRGVLLSGDEHGFVAGLDVRELGTYLQSNTDARWKERYGATLRRGREAMRIIEELEVPTVAAVSQHAIGGGLEIALACDFIIADETSRFAFPEVKLGLLPGAGGTVLLPQRVGVARARRLILSGETVAADEAFAIGLVDELCQSHELIGRARSFLVSMCSKSPAATRACKRASNDPTHRERYEKEAALFEERLADEHTLELVEEYLARRGAPRGSSAAVAAQVPSQAERSRSRS